MSNFHTAQPSRRLRLAIFDARSRGTTQYALARAAGIHPVTLSSLLRGSRATYYADERIIRIGKLLGLSADECFDPLAPDMEREA